MNYRELPPSLLTAAIDIVNVQLINRVCNFVARANKEGTQVSKHLSELARNGPRQDTKPSDRPDVKARIAIMAEKDKELCSGVGDADVKRGESEHHVTDTDSFVRDVVAKELIDLKRCRENMKEKLLGPEDSEEIHQQKSVPKRRVSLGGRANHILDARHELSLTREQSLLSSPKVKIKSRHASIKMSRKISGRRPRTASPRKRTLRSGELVHRKGGVLKFRTSPIRVKKKNRGSSSSGALL